MELLKLYRGINDNHLALHRNDAGQFFMTLSYKGHFRKLHPYRKMKAWLILDHFEMELRRNPELQMKPVPLLVATYEGRTRYFETPSDLEHFYSGHGVDASRVADLLSRNIPVIFGRLTAYREKPWHFNDGHVASIYGKRFVT
ncbi:hypothetical protein [Bacterioplanoides sp.]|uniref:hypothetical protein n=1 Tax=Bacterioplanoides sp. TaxID=2066072 RepID=UPI003B5B2468